MSWGSVTNPFREDVSRWREELQAEIDRHAPYDRQESGALAACCAREIQATREATPKAPDYRNPVRKNEPG